jgi:hypothetical protein
MAQGWEVEMAFMNAQTSIIAAADFTAPGAYLLYQNQTGTHPAGSRQASIGSATHGN